MSRKYKWKEWLFLKFCKFPLVFQLLYGFAGAYTEPEIIQIIKESLIKIVEVQKLKKIEVQKFDDLTNSNLALVNARSLPDARQIK